MDLTHFDSSLVMSTSNMFLGCVNIEEIKFSNFNTSSITNMDGMFSSCINLKSLDLSSFRTSNIQSMNRSILKFGISRYIKF